MARKKKHAEHVNHERWLVSYADFITLLFAFFVVMFAASNSDSKKAGQISQAVQVAFQQLAVFDPGSKAVPLNGSGNAVSAGFAEAALIAAASKKATGDMEGVKHQLEDMLKEEVDSNLVRINQDS